MGKIPAELRTTIAVNIRKCRLKRFPGRGGGMRCAAAFGVSPQQWSPWERGMRTPDELRMRQIARFFNVTVEYLRTDHTAEAERQSAPPPSTPFIDDQPSPPPLLARDVRCMLAALTKELTESGIKVTITLEKQAAPAHPVSPPSA